MQKCHLRSALTLMWLWNNWTWFNLLDLLFKWKCHPLFSVGGLSLSLLSPSGSFPCPLCSFSPLSLISLSVPLSILLPHPLFFSLPQPPYSPHAHTPTHCLTHPCTHCICLYPNWIKSVLFPWLTFPSCLADSACVSFVLVVENERREEMVYVLLEVDDVASDLKNSSRCWLAAPLISILMI